MIGDGVADKEVVLNNVTVTGKTIVRGGGENSIIITGTSDISDMVIRQVNNKVSIKVKGDAKVRMVYINDGSNDVNIVGTVGTVNIVGENLKVTLTDAVVNTLIVADTAKNAVVEADKNSSIKEATLNAAGTQIQGEGKVEAINVNANDTVVTVKDAKINVKDNVTPPKQMRITIVRQQRIPISVMIIIRVAVPPVVDLLQVEAQLQVEAAKIQVLRMFRR